MSVQRGDQRQYFENFMPQNTGSAWGTLLQEGVNVVQKIKQDSDMSKFADLQAKQQIELYQANEEHKIKFQANPNSEEAKQAWQESFKSVSSKYDEEAPTMLKRSWYQQQKKILNSYDATNLEWSLSQNKINTQENLKNSLENNLILAQQQGQKGDIIGALASFAASHNAMLQSGKTVLGETYTNAFLHGYEADYMTMFISGMTDTNPAKALQMLNDKRVVNSINDPRTVEQLSGAAQSKFINQHKETTVKSTAELILSKGAMGTKLLNGEGTHADLQKFFKSNPKLTPNQRDLLTSFAGYGSYSNYVINRDTGAVEYKKHGGSGGGGFSLSPLAKDNLSSILEIEGGSLLSFTSDDLKNMSSKKTKTENGKEYQSNVVGMLGQVKQYQDKVDAYYNAGIIDKSTRMRLHDSYIVPMAEYLHANLKDLDEHQNWFMWGKKLGYDNIYKTFNPDGLKGQKLQETNRELALAQVYYFDNLRQAASQRGKGNIYELEKLSSADQQEIYKNASNAAIQKAKLNSVNPSFYFQRDYPTEYTKIINALPRKDAKKLANTLSPRVINDLSLNPEAVSKIVDTSIRNQIATNRSASQQIIDQSYNKKVTPIEIRAKNIGYSMDDINYTAKKYNTTPQRVLTELELKEK